jgi:chromosome segregation ATPase
MKDEVKKLQANIPIEFYDRLDELGGKTKSESTVKVFELFFKNVDDKSDLEMQIQNLKENLDDKDQIIAKKDNRISMLEGNIKDLSLANARETTKVQELEKHLKSLQAQIATVNQDKENLNRIINENFKTILAFVENQGKSVIEATYSDQKYLNEPKVKERSRWDMWPLNYLRNKAK